MKKLFILAALAAFAIPQSAQAQLELIAGWDTFAFNPANRAPNVNVGLDENSSTFSVINASSDNQHQNGQFDGTWGSLDLTPAPNIDSGQNPDQDPAVTAGSTVVSRFVNGNNASYEFTIVDSSGTDRDLGFFVFDGGSFRPRSARNWELSVVSGALTTGVVASGRLDPGSGFVENEDGDRLLGVWTDVDISLSDLADNTLDANGTVTFGLAFTGGGLNDEGEVPVDPETGEPLSLGGNHGYLDNVGIGIGELPTPPSILGDFNGDEVVDLLDLDQYNGNLDTPVSEGDALFALDLDGDGNVGVEDFEQHYSQLVETSNGEVGTAQGDINLDGRVDVLNDAFALIQNLGLPATSWGQGDINASGNVDVLGDAFVLTQNLGADNAAGGASPSASAVPEPGSLSLLALAGLGAVIRRRR